MRTVKDYWVKKRNKKTFAEQWDDLLNNVILPTVQRIEAREVVRDLIPIQPMAAPSELPIYHQNGVTNEINVPFWKIKVIFKNNIE